MDIVGQNEFFDMDSLFFKAAFQIDRLAEFHDAVVIAMD